MSNRNVIIEVRGTQTVIGVPIQVGSSTVPWKQDEFTPTAGQTVFSLITVPTDSVSIEFYVNGVLYDDVTDFTVSGATITWLNTPFSMATTDKVLIRYK